MSTAKAFIRFQKIESTLRKAIVESLVELGIDGCIVTRIDISKDIRNAKVYYIIDASEDRNHVTARIKTSRGSIAREVSKKFHTRIFPKISFLVDTGAEASARINALLDALPEPRQD